MSYPAAAAPAPPPSPPSAAVNNAARAAPDPERWANIEELVQNGKGNQWPTKYLTSDGLYYVQDKEGKHRSKNLRYVHENGKLSFSDKEFFNHYPGRRPSGGRRSTRKNRTRRRSTRKNRGRQMKKNRKITYKN